MLKRGENCPKCDLISIFLHFNNSESIPLLARNLPPSFFDSSWVGQPSLPPQPHADLYSEYGDPWQSYMASMTGNSGKFWVFRLFNSPI